MKTRGEGGPKIHAMAYRPIYSSYERRVGFRRPDHPMARWPDPRASRDVSEKKEFSSLSYPRAKIYVIDNKVLSRFFRGPGTLVSHDVLETKRVSDEQGKSFNILCH